MLRSYFKIAYRNLWRNKLHTSVNLGGLTIGFTIGSSINFHVLARIENRPHQATEKNDWGDRAPLLYVRLKEGITSREAENQLRGTGKYLIKRKKTKDAF